MRKSLFTPRFGGVPEEWRDGRRIGPLQTCCYRDEDENGEILMEDRKERKTIHLPVCRTSVSTGGLRQKVLKYQ